MSNPNQKQQLEAHQDLENALILIVDDTPKNIQLLGRVLKNFNANVAVATNGMQALSFLEKRIPDLIMLDIMMPEIDGYETCRRMKANPATADIPVIFLSAKTEIDDKVRGFEVGGVDYITKPFQATEIIARTRTHLQLKWAKEKLNNYAQELEAIVEKRTKALIRAERNSAFSLILQGLVHNMKGRLTAITGGAELILSEKDEVAELMQQHPELAEWSVKEKLESIFCYAELIQEGGNNLNDMIGSMLTKSRTDKVDETQIIDLNQLLKSEIEFLDANLEFKHLYEREIEISTGRLNIEVVPAELAQVFQNLISNALDAVQGMEKPKISVKSGLQDDQAWFTVTDNGCGISEEDLQHIFDPFFTTKQADELRATGTGLGLYSCSETIRSYNGQVQVMSEPGKGTTFRVFIPEAVGNKIGALATGVEGLQLD